VLPAVGTELLHLETLCRGFLIFGVGVVPVFALGALERDDLSWHWRPFTPRKTAAQVAAFALFPSYLT
jgi:hypothetical protein